MADRVKKVIRGGSLLRWTVAAALLMIGLHPVTARAQDAESIAFNAAAKSFQDGVYDRAERELAQFTLKFPASLRLAEAALLQAQAALNQHRPQTAITLLHTNQAKAGPLAEDYQYWLARSYFEAANYQAAIDAFAHLIATYTNSTRLLASSYGQALAAFRQGRHAETIRLLTTPEGVFKRLSAAKPRDEMAIRATLLLAEAYIAGKHYSEAAAVLTPMDEKGWLAEPRWWRQYLMAQVLARDQGLTNAIGTVSNLMALAALTGQPKLLAESVEFQGRLYERMGQWSSASHAYNQNLAPSTPADYRQRAWLKIVQGELAQGHVGEAAEKLKELLERDPNAGASDLALLTVGELRLRQHFGQSNTLAGATSPANARPQPSATNSLRYALGCFQQLLTNYPQSTLRGRAFLGQGWCLWAEDKHREAQAAFRLATEHLPWSVDQAVARFKLGDCLFAAGDLTNASVQYRTLLSDYTNLTAVAKELAPHAHHQLLHAYLDMGDLAGATASMERLLKSDSGKPFTERGFLLLGFGLSEAGKAAEARSVLTQFMQRFGASSPLAPRVELAIARTYVTESSHARALAAFEDWLSRNPQHPLRPEAEFHKAWSLARSGRETNAFQQFTNFAAQYPTHSLAPQAQWWVADFYYTRGDTLALLNAEKAYQLLFQNTNWASSSLAYPAWMMAGRAAFARQAFSQAEDYFTNLLSTACPPDIAAEAFFALGDTYIREAGDPDLGVAKYREAAKAFEKIPQNYPSSPLAAPAYGRMGDCYLQLAAQEPKFLDLAAEAYTKAMAASDVGVRCQAEMGLAHALKRQGKAIEARDHLLNILYASNLRPGEKPLPFWSKEAGLAAAELAESQKDWALAANIYSRMLGQLAPMKAILEKKLEKAREQLRLGQH